MESIESIETFYRSKLNWMPDNLKKELGHFNVFKLEDFAGRKCSGHNRKEYYKISLIRGRNRYEYADKVIDTEKNALIFSNPQVPYHYDVPDEEHNGYFCIFTAAFFQQFGASRLYEYPVMKPDGQPIYVLSDEQFERIQGIFEKMLREIASDFAYKYDVLRTCVFELMHEAIRLQPAATLYTNTNAATRISSLFMELLERQFPVESPVQQMGLRSATDFASQLSVHVNHLNKALKETTGRTTSQLIGERILQEARSLLKHTDWNISEVGWSLGFEELPHFINFFKKNTTISPSVFRKSID
jgi:AraC-like DNA-binding protein